MVTLYRHVVNPATQRHIEHWAEISSPLLSNFAKVCLVNFLKADLLSRWLVGCLFVRLAHLLSEACIGDTLAKYANWMWPLCTVYTHVVNPARQRDHRKSHISVLNLKSFNPLLYCFPLFIKAVECLSVHYYCWFWFVVNEGLVLYLPYEQSVINVGRRNYFKCWFLTF